jgi:hypothetical protein
VDFVNRLVERTRADRNALRPVIGPVSPVADVCEPLLEIDNVREVLAPLTASPVASSPMRTSPAFTPIVASDRVSSREPWPSAVPGSVASPSYASSIDPADIPPSAPVPAVIVPTTGLDRERQPDRDRMIADPSPSTVPARAPHDVQAALARDSAPDRARRSPALAASREAAATGEQVIRIHIGRIDVRAPAPAAAPNAKRPAQPLPSVALGRYLDDRGRRR